MEEDLMADQLVPLSQKSRKEIEKALDIINNKPTPRKITKLKINQQGDLVIVHAPVV